MTIEIGSLGPFQVGEETADPGGQMRFEHFAIGTGSFLTGSAVFFTQLTDGPGQSRTLSCGPSMSSKPCARSATSSRCVTVSHGRRMSAPIIGGPTGALNGSLVNPLDEILLGIYGEITLLIQEGEFK